ncbi:hypothetical protein FHW12_000557 [Dokdonella fugitiva]|uniref:Uncharacterized protein n=1 Tax=Dokdonella fugitiva TaxID=328517 RepID=A0A839EVD0_9GAMM|nr:hypothetical protein [Dokdonella fugitiva]MBA8886366.1 hypothetical protein [Dokdonella fugitiva]
MSIAKTSGTWQRIAVFEIDADAPIVDDLRGNAPDSRHLIIPARESPPGLRWYEVYVDFGIGEVLAIRLAQAQLQAVQRWATAGLMPGFRLVSGVEWLTADGVRPRTEWRLDKVSGARDLN